MKKATLEDLRKEQRRRKENLCWVTRDNQVMPITAMSDQHLENTIKMLERAEAQEWKEAQRKRDEAFWKMVSEVGEKDFVRYYM